MVHWQKRWDILSLKAQMFCCMIFNAISEQYDLCRARINSCTQGLATGKKVMLNTCEC